MSVGWIGQEDERMSTMLDDIQDWQAWLYMLACLVVLGLLGTFAS